MKKPKIFHVFNSDFYYLKLQIALEEKPWFTTSVYNCFLVEKDILQLTI